MKGFKHSLVAPSIFLSFASLREIAFLREARAQAEPFNF